MFILHWGMRKHRACFWLVFCLIVGQPAYCFTLPANFDNIEVISGLEDPDGLAFSPDGRMFISERISGKLRIASYNSSTAQWVLSPTPFHVFDTPKDGSGQPSAHRSAGLRDIAFDPDFAVNGLIYAFYMKNDPDNLHNRVVRIKQSSASPGVSDSSFGSGGEQLLIDLPFNSTSSSGSHNGGGVEFDGNGDLFITTGDGWEGPQQGDPVQNLSSFTGKVLRLNRDGSIPADNPFYAQTTGTYRAIYALGLRNPYSLSRNPDTGELYINEARGTNKAQIYKVESGANYGHEGTGIGTARAPWANASGAGGELITGGAWMPQAGLGGFPNSYNGVYFTALWGGNSTATGQISYISSISDTSVTAFETDVGSVGSNGIAIKPVVTRIGPEGDLYYLLTTYTTSSGTIRRVRFTNQATVATPVFSPAPGVYDIAQSVAIASTTDSTDIYYTTDNSEPTTGSNRYTNTPFSVSSDIILKAKAFKSGFNPSATASGIYLIGQRPNNLPPIVNAGTDKVVFIGQNVTLDGSATTDPDGEDDFLTGELWTQLSGPEVSIVDSTEEIASFTPTQGGVYQFQLEVSDGFDSGFDQVTFTAIEAPRVTDGISVLYTFLEAGGNVVTDQSSTGTALDLTILDPGNVAWIAGGGLDIANGTLISALDNKISAQCKSTNEITLETWIKPENATQAGPARILSLSSNLHNRNFTLGQEDSRYDTRLRTTNTNNNGVPSLTVPASTVNTVLSHVVYTRQDNGEARIYLDAIPQVAGTVSGNFTNWNNVYTLTLVNELTNDRDWLGEIYLAAVYCKALSNTEVQQNFSAGLPPFNAPPQPDMDSDGVIDLMDNCPGTSNANQANLDGDDQGDVCDADIDNDGVNNLSDTNPTALMVCQDLDADSCDDCTVGVDGFGPLADYNTANDGLDTDGDGMCNRGDLDDDNDQVNDTEDNCPLHSNPLPAQDPTACGAMGICFPVKSAPGTIVRICW